MSSESGVGWVRVWIGLLRLVPWLVKERLLDHNNTLDAHTHLKQEGLARLGLGADCHS